VTFIEAKADEKEHSKKRTISIMNSLEENFKRLKTLNN
jgi:hypothetical protein